ncbi:MAG: DUF4012 domain-containing protein [Anaerolineae bacterium]|nr:DUF4012 domain-containing protein [Anaerolineae bacterium]
MWSTFNRIRATLTEVREYFDIHLDSLDELGADDLSEAQFRINLLIEDLIHLKQQTHILRPLALLQPDLKVALEGMATAEELMVGVRHVTVGLYPLLEQLNLSNDQSQSVSLEDIAFSLQEGSADFAKADGNFTRVEDQITNFDLSYVSPLVLTEVEKFTRYTTQLHNMTRILLSGSDFLLTAFGFVGDQNYLILSQNSDEIRPSGGYISTFGWLQVRDGLIAGYGYSPTTDQLPIPPVSDLSEQINIPDWWLEFHEPIYAAWDGSWYADFPSTAKMAQWYYENGGNPFSPLDGVIGIDLVGFEYLLSAIGEVQLPNYGVSVNPENFRTIVYGIRASSEESELLHKKFLSDLYRQIITSWQTISQNADGNIRLIEAIVKALQEKHVMIYFSDNRLSSVIDLLGWSGQQTPTAHADYLMVADANLGNKSNRSIIRSMVYETIINLDGSLNSRLAISYEYPDLLAAFDPAVRPEHYWVRKDYFNLFQIFVPADSQLLDIDYDSWKVERVSEDLYASFISFVQVPYDDSRQIELVYSTEPLVESFGDYRKYSLLFQKQPGVLTELLKLSIQLPKNTSIISVIPPEYSIDDQTQPELTLDLRLLTDQWIEVIYKVND